MNREDIIRMALEAGYTRYDSLAERLHEFAALVAAHTLANIDPSKFMSYREGFEVGVAAERRKFCATLRQLQDVYSLQSDVSGLHARSKE